MKKIMHTTAYTCSKEDLKNLHKAARIYSTTVLMEQGR